MCRPRPPPSRYRPVHHFRSAPSPHKYPRGPEDKARTEALQPRTADVIADIYAADAELGRLAHHIDRKMLLLVPPDLIRRDFVRGELPRHVAKRNLVLVESELHLLPAPCLKRLCARSIHRRNGKLRAFLDAGGPARGYRLGLGIETDRIRPVLVEVAEAGLLPAAESVIGDRHRDRHVDADHTDIDLGREIARGVAIAGEDRNAIAIVVIRRQAQRLLVVVGAHYRQHRTEDLLLVDPHVLCDIVEQAPAHIKTVLGDLHPEIAAVDRERGAFLDADLDIILDAIKRLPGHQRTIVGGWIDRSSDLQGLDARNEVLHQPVARGLADGHRDRDRHAAFAGRTIAGA